MQGLPRNRLYPSPPSPTPLQVVRRAPTLYSGMAPTEVTADPAFREQYEQLTIANRISWLQLCAMSPLPAGRFLTPLRGNALDLVNGTYVELARNIQANPVGVAVYAQFNGIGALGAQTKIALSNDAGDSTVVDYLGASPNPPSFNKRISQTIILNPAERLFIALAETFPAPPFPTDASDLFVVRMMDPGSYMSDSNWETRGQP